MLLLFYISFIAFASAAKIPSISIDPPRLSLDRIINGTEVEKFAYPFMVRLSVRLGQQAGLCGGSLISDRFVLTAAHCIYNRLTGGWADKVVVSLGVHTRSYSEPERIERISTKFHTTNYMALTQKNDIALLELEEPVSFSHKIQPACIDGHGESHTGQMLKAIGWGRTEATGSPSDVLREVDLPVLEDELCSKKYKVVFKSEVMICAGYTDGSKDTCQGDSGGPLFTKINGKFTVVGATSFGKQCAALNYPGIYTKLSHFTQWIQEIVGNDLCVN